MRRQRGTTLAYCVTSTGMPAKNTATIFKQFMPIYSQPLLHIVQHVANCIAPFPRSQDSPAPLKFFHTPLHLSPLLPSFTCQKKSHQAYMWPWRRRPWRPACSTTAAGSPPRRTAVRRRRSRGWSRALSRCQYPHSWGRGGRRGGRRAAAGCLPGTLKEGVWWVAGTLPGRGVMSALYWVFSIVIIAGNTLEQTVFQQLKRICPIFSRYE